MTRRAHRSPITVGAVQMNCTLEAREENVARALAFVEESEELDILCFPELFTTGYHLEALHSRLAELAEPIPGPTTERFAATARRAGTSILGTIIERDSGTLYDTTFVIDHEKGYRGKYRKTHLYPAEHRYFTPGDRLAVFEVDRAAVGVAICFEHAFPPIASTLAFKGAKIVFNPTAVPVGYEYLMEVRNRARSQDNQLFFISANHVGAEGDRRYCGLSQIIDPRGTVLAQADDESEGMSCATLELAGIDRERTQEPALSHFRPELYVWRWAARGKSGQAQQDTLP